MTNARAEPRGYDEVRAALLERGYLETPLERLFLGPGVRGQLVSALIAGALAGPTLGILLAGVLVLEARGAVPVWPDGVLYALLFAPVLGIIVALAEATAGVAIRTLGRLRPGLSPRRAALVAGLAVAAALAAYLGLWWLRGGGGISLRDLLGLVVLAGGAGFAGRVVSAAALIQAAFAMGRAPTRPRPRTVTLLLGATLLVSALVAGLAAWAAREAEGQPVVVRANAPPRSILVGWDGLSLELLRGLERQGVTFLPAAGGAEAEIDPGTWHDPVVVWTTVATGSPPDVHGVTGLELPGLRGADAPMPTAGLARGPLDLLARLWPVTRRVVHSGVRRTPAAWEITADARKTAVVGWWGTWPASAPGAAGGYVVSDGALAALQRGRGLEKAIHPASWGAARGPQWLEGAHAGVQAALGDCTEAEGGLPCAIAREALVVDLFAVNALADALRDPEVGSAFLYLPGIDILRERGRSLRVDPFALLAAVRRHAQAAAQALRAGIPEGAFLGLAGLPGRVGSGETGVLRVGRGAGDVAPAGGTGALESAMPTWLAATGYPVDDRMTGRPLPGLAGAGEQVLRTRARPVATPPPPEALEGDVLERLRSLGYVQ